MVGCKTPTSIIDNSLYKDKKIYLMSIDAEGDDLEVLKSIDFYRYKPSLLVVEIHENILSKRVDSDLFQYINNKGYDLVGWCGVSIVDGKP